MDKYQALHGFWSSFGIKAYDENTVPDSAELPYITYEISEADYDSPVPMSASLWYKGKSWSAITQKLNQVDSALKNGGKMVPYDNGAVFVVKGTPFAQRMNDPDDSIRRIYINIMAEYIGG